MEQHDNKYESIAYNASIEFSDAADYFWKSPKLIEHETKIEVEKIKTYFTNDDEHAKLRWKIESFKLKNVFPYLIAVGNMFSIMSLFETYLLIISREIEKKNNIKINSINGNGINRIYKYLRQSGVNVDELPYYHQINAAIKIRNCLSHASGTLSWSNDASELRRLIKSGNYFSKDHRERRIKNNSELYEVKIVSTEFGDKVIIDDK